MRATFVEKAVSLNVFLLVMSKKFTMCVTHVKQGLNLLETHSFKAHNYCGNCEKQLKISDLENHTELCELQNY